MVKHVEGSVPHKPGTRVREAGEANAELGWSLSESTMMGRAGHCFHSTGEKTKGCKGKPGFKLRAAAYDLNLPDCRSAKLP